MKWCQQCDDDGYKGVEFVLDEQWLQKVEFFVVELDDGCQVGEVEDGGDSS